MKGGCQTLKILLEGNREDKTKWPTYAAFHEKGRMTRRDEANYRGGKALLSLQVPSYPPHLVVPSRFCYCIICLPVPGPFLTGYHHLNSPLSIPPCSILLVVYHLLPSLTYLKKFLGVFNHKSHPTV